LDLGGTFDRACLSPRGLLAAGGKGVGGAASGGPAHPQKPRMDFKPRFTSKPMSRSVSKGWAGTFGVGPSPSNPQNIQPLCNRPLVVLGWARPPQPLTPEVPIQDHD